MTSSGVAAARRATGAVRAALGAVVLLAMAAGAAFAVEGDAPDLARLKKVFAGKASAEERLSAARALVLADSKEGAELACRAAAQCLDTLAALAEERSKHRDLLAKKQGAEGLKAIPYYPEDVRGEIQALLARESELRAADAAERAVLQALRRGLSAYDDPGAMGYLTGTALRSHPSEGLRVLVADVLAERGSAAALPPLVAALGDRSDRVREAALAALARIAPADPACLAAFAGAARDAAWPIRLAAARAIACSGRPEAVDLLLELLPKEEGRQRRDVASLLAAMTGEHFGAEPEGWRAWWGEHRAAYASGAERLRKGPFEAGEGAGGAAAPVHYYGIETWSRRILFVLDISGSMEEPGGRDRSVPRLEEAKREFLSTLRSIDAAGGFGLFVFSDAVRKWKPALVPATTAAKEDVTAWVRGLGASSWTNTFAALEEAFRVSAASGVDERYGGADTVFLLTDGAPTTPEGKPRHPDGSDEAERVLAAVRDWNAGRRVELHCIGVGHDVNTSFLSRLARENGGRFVHVK